MLPAKLGNLLTAQLGLIGGLSHRTAGRPDGACIRGPQLGAWHVVSARGVCHGVMGGESKRKHVCARTRTFYVGGSDF